MYDSYITFSSLTAAQRALSACRAVGILAELVRTPRELSFVGCGYALRLAGSAGLRAAMELRLSGIGFSHLFQFRAGRWEEVPV